MKTEKDWVGEWFRLHEERGENVDMWLGYRKAPGDAHTLVKTSHATHDGMTASVAALQQEGLLEGLSLPRMPKRRGLFRPMALWGLYRMFRRGPMKGGTLPRLPEPIPGKEDALRYHVFTTEEAKALRAQCKEKGERFEAVLLKALDTSVRKEMIVAGPNRWMLPMTLRESFDETSLKGNRAAFLDVDVAQDDKPADLTQKIVRSYLALEHEITFFVLGLGRWLGIEWMKRTLDSKSGGAVRTGVMTGLGRWGDVSHPLRDSIIYGATPTASFLPVSTSWAIWMGKLVLTVRINRQVVDSEAVSERVLSGWKTLLFA